MTRGGRAALASLFAVADTARAAAAHPLAWRQLLAVSPATLLATAPRLLPHGLVLAVAVGAVLSGGFSRPDDPVAALMSAGSMGAELGQASVAGRFAFGSRTGEVQVRDSLVRPAVSTTSQAPSAPRSAPAAYTVQPGDTIWDIGARFNVGSYSVLWSNGLDEDAIIKPGQELWVPPVPGTLHQVRADDNLDDVARKYNVDPAVIVDFNRLRPGEGLVADKVLVIPGGQLPLVRRPVAPPPPTVSRALPTPAPAPAPVAARPAIPVPAQPAPRTAPQPAQPLRPVPLPAPAPAPAAPVPTGRLSWPTRGVITTYFSGWHPGIDIAAPIGTGIAAADGGTITFTGWDSTGYGYRVVISHGNGYSTTYNHLSSIGVRPGQTVGKGQIIAAMGSTGRSTGSHLHFEILRNGSFVNPLGTLG
ncbi:MAG: hypothetical protein AVDCRST_MAG77-3842 [uncultured Chloroflexi bacterium]|uniref:LysM domain-containing protein n=1 Tax=uncultured Chloroflexota bacterium TaxID=166587 RepID=A0A6J4JKQ1_9CHLR|nr:MAG: hypothetical protein AVDCRST_MAG77-3842 [uncultured Chloroflexota bacterium]